jgi:hypothetical protein
VNAKSIALSLVKNAWPLKRGKSQVCFVSKIYNKYKKSGEGSANWNGYLFEALIHRLLIQAGVDPKCIHINAKLALIEDTKYDIVLCAEKTPSGVQFPICLSLKTSLRERYKQAEREGMIAKQVHRGSFTALLTMEEKTPETLYGLDRIVGCNNSIQLADLLREIKSMNLVTFDKIRPLGCLISKGESPSINKIRSKSLGN